MRACTAGLLRVVSHRRQETRGRCGEGSPGSRWRLSPPQLSVPHLLCHLLSRTLTDVVGAHAGGIAFREEGSSEDAGDAAAAAAAARRRGVHQWCRGIGTGKVNQQTARNAVYTLLGEQSAFRDHRAGAAAEGVGGAIDSVVRIAACFWKSVRVQHTASLQPLLNNPDAPPPPSPLLIAEALAASSQVLFVHRSRVKVNSTATMLQQARAPTTAPCCRHAQRRDVVTASASPSAPHQPATRRRALLAGAAAAAVLPPLLAARPALAEEAPAPADVAAAPAAAAPAGIKVLEDQPGSGTAAAKVGDLVLVRRSAARGGWRGTPVQCF